MDEMAASAETPVPEPVSAEPTRVQLRVRVLPETKARLARVTEPLPALFERAAAAWEAALLERLRLDRRSRFRGEQIVEKFYLEGTLSAEVAFGHNALRNTKIGAGAGRVDFVVLVPEETRAALKRFAKFYGLSLADVLDRLSRQIAKRMPDPPGEGIPEADTEAQPVPKPVLDPELAHELVAPDEAEEEQPEPLREAAE
jgi:hypothetical protein